MMMNGELAGFTIPRLGMGTMALAIEGRPDRDTAIRTIHAGLDAGVELKRAEVVAKVPVVELQ